MNTQSHPIPAADAAHTPTPAPPWKVTDTLTVTVEGHSPTQLYSVEAEGYFCGGGVALVRKEANAAFIVRACNSHAALVEELGNILIVAEDAMTDNETQRTLKLKGIITMARAALALARGDHS